MDRILISCQRPTLAEKASYSYARGGTPITGATIRLMEVVAQNWGNLQWGFRELQRFPGRGKDPGESIVEAFAWDLETNAKRNVQFTVSHYDSQRKKNRLLTDQRDIYEYVSNQAQRRVRTCLEDVIPRDIAEAALEECAKTLKTKFPVTPQRTANMLAAFEEVGVPKAAIEKRLQRNLDSMTSAQYMGLLKIGTSIREGMSEPADWFDLSDATEEQEPETAIDKVKAAMRKKAAEAGAAEPPAGMGTDAPSGGSTAPKAEAAPPPAPKSPPKPAPANKEPKRAAASKKEASPEPAADSAAPAADSQPPMDPAGVGSPEKDGQQGQPGAPAEAAVVKSAAPTDPAPPEQPNYEEQASQWLTDLESVNTIRGLKDALAAIPPVWPDECKELVAFAIKQKIDAVRGDRGERSNEPHEQPLFGGGNPASAAGA